MTLPVFWHPGVGSARVGTTVELDGDEGRHAAVVRRIRAGEQVVLADGSGARATGDVLETSKAGLTIRIVEAVSEPRPAQRFTVVQAIPKGERAELAVEVLTEIGVDVIVPWAASRSVGVWRGERAEKSLGKWRATAREAAKQSRRAWFPEVAEQASTAEVAGIIAASDLALVLHEEAVAPLGAVPAGVESVVLVVGPEGGIAPDELASFEAAGAQLVQLGPTVLRTSTAGLAAMAALLSTTSRWITSSHG